MHSVIALTALFATSVFASNLQVINNCGNPVYIRTSHNGACDVGADGTTCYGTPFEVDQGQTQQFDFIADGEGTSIKIATNADVNNGILQFEYTVSDNIYWDVSDLDGVGAARVGSPFSGDNVWTGPVGGSSVGQGTCTPVICLANQICQDAYQQPDQKATHGCQDMSTNFQMFLCSGNAYKSRRAISFNA
ncbi:hypothetical protein G7Y89_g5001 [Cudoniella acicularis]|uniref:Uncharacterized protein n=1 Tax=Cudoniella acicularis TaxID=354080 RepID=A0A8H4W6W4_9HELO|nr:hypothetical protein G7Y89_g5001 [Cudoniella acicularis]